jgi:uncharacterized integral membrane protein
MPWRLIQFIVVFAIFLLFIGFNLENKCDIKFGTEKMVLKDVPVYFTVFCSFIIGMLCALPFVFRHKSQKKADTGQRKGLLRKITGRKGEKPGSLPKETQTPQETQTPGAQDTGPSDKSYGID